MRRHFEIYPSRYLTAVLVAAHGVALAALLPFLPPWAGLALAAVMLISLLYYLKRDAWLRLPASCIGVVLEGDGATILRRDGVRVPCWILRDSLVTPHLTVLNLLPQGARFARSVVILPDSLDAESFRELRVRLKWGNQDGAL